MKRRNPHVKTLISIGGGSGSDEFPTLAESSSARQKFARQVRDFCDRHHFDGVDSQYISAPGDRRDLLRQIPSVDWEHPTTPTHGQNYLKLLIDVRAQLSTPKYLLTTALPTGEYCLRNIDLCCASQYLDFLNLMGYDFTGPWTEVAGHHAQLHEPKGSLMKSAHPELKKSCSRGVEDVLKTGFPCNKILLGIPAYARYFPKAVAAGQPSQNVAGEIDYCDLPGHWPKEATIDKELRAASFVDEEKGFVSFDVPATVALKARYANQMRLGGLFFWTGVGDRCDDMSLVEAGHCGLLTRYEP